MRPLRASPLKAQRESYSNITAWAACPFPLSLLETRAETAISGDNPNVARPVLGQLFPTSIAAFAGVAVETVPSGEAGYPVITTGATVEALAQGASGTESTGAITITTLVPKRLQASLRYQREDAARLSYLDASLRENLSMALAAKLDEQILNRATVGLLTFGSAPTVNGATVSNLTHALASIYGSVDGIFAQTASEVRLLLGDNTYPALGKELVSTLTVGNVTIGTSFSLEKLNEISGGVRVSTHVPDYASNHAGRTRDHRASAPKRGRGCVEQPGFSRRSLHGGCRWRSDHHGLHDAGLRDTPHGRVQAISLQVEGRHGRTRNAGSMGY